MGNRYNRLSEAAPTSTHNLYFEQKYEKYLSFLAENFQFLVVKFSIHLNRRVSVMIWLRLSSYGQLGPISEPFY